jgi:transposase
MEAMRCLKRRLSDIACHQMIPGHRAAQAGPGGHMGASLISSAAGSHPAAGTSDKSLPGPATSNATPSRRTPETISLT